MRQRICLHSAKIAHLLRRGRNSGTTHESTPFAPPLLRPEKESAVFSDWTIKIKTEIVVAQRRPGLARPVKKEVTGIQNVIPKELKASAVKLIGAAFGD